MFNLSLLISINANLKFIKASSNLYFPLIFKVWVENLQTFLRGRAEVSCNLDTCTAIARIFQIVMFKVYELTISGHNIITCVILRQGWSTASLTLIRSVVKVTYHTYADVTPVDCSALVGMCYHWLTDWLMFWSTIHTSGNLAHWL